MKISRFLLCICLHLKNVSFMRAPIIFLWVIHNLLQQQHKNSLLYIVLLAAQHKCEYMWSSLPKINKKTNGKSLRNHNETYSCLCLLNSLNKRLKRIIIIIWRELFPLFGLPSKKHHRGALKRKYVSGGSFREKKCGTMKNRKKYFRALV